MFFDVNIHDQPQINHCSDEGKFYKISVFAWGSRDPSCREHDFTCVVMLSKDPLGKHFAYPNASIFKRVPIDKTLLDRVLGAKPGEVKLSDEVKTFINTHRSDILGPGPDTTSTIPRP